MGWQDAKGIKIVTKNFGVPNSHKLATYQQRGGWDGFRRALTMPPASIVDEVKKSNLRGRGGAGFSTGMKWSFVPKEAKRVYLVVNADESEPGTCKDRELMAYDPHLLIEGMAIACYALGCKHAYIYIRGEMMREAQILQAAIDEAYEGGWLGKDHLTGSGVFKLDITLHRGAGAYICGEETALLNSLEGKRGWPRLKPPFPAVKGLFQEADHRQQRRDADERPRHRRARAASGSPSWGWASRAARASSASRATSRSRASTSCPWASRSASSSTTSAAG